MESATDYGIITMNTERKVERWSQGATQLFGYTEAEITGQLADIIYTGEDREAGVPQKEMETARYDFHKVLRFIGFSCLKKGKIEYLKDELLEIISEAKNFLVAPSLNPSFF